MKTDRRSRIGVLIGVLILGAVVFSFSGAADATHGGLHTPPWLNKMVNHDGEFCCGDQDCIPIPRVAILGRGARTTSVLIGGRAAEINNSSFVDVPSGESDQCWACLRTAGDGIPCMGEGGVRFAPSCVRCIACPQPENVN